MEIFLYFYLYLDSVTRLNANFYTQWNKNAKKTFDEYPKTKLINNKKKMRTEHNLVPVKDYGACLETCQKLDGCLAFNAISDQDGTLSCEYFSSASGGFIPKENTILFTTSSPRCSGYCEELSYLNVCAGCKCISLCNSLIPFYCDCIGHIKEPLGHCKTPIKVYGYPLAAHYNVQYADEKPFSGFCQVHVQNVKGELWLTVLRRLVLSNQASLTAIGYGQPYHDNFFIGYKYLAEITKQQSNMTLSLIFHDKGKAVLNYAAFKVKELNVDRGEYALSYGSVSNSVCNPLYREQVGSSCLSTEPTCIFTKFIKRSMTILLQSLDQDVGKSFDKRTFLMKKDFKNKCCITFEFHFLNSMKSCKIIALVVNDKPIAVLYFKKNELIFRRREVFRKISTDGILHANHFNKIELSLEAKTSIKNNKTIIHWDSNLYLNNKMVAIPKRNIGILIEECDVILCHDDFCDNSCKIRNLFINGEPALQKLP